MNATERERIIVRTSIIGIVANMLRETIDDILGHRPNPDLAKGIKRTVCADPQVLGAYDLLLDSYGPDLTVGDVHVEVPDTMSAAEIDAMTRRIQASVYEEHRIALATVGIYSRNTTSDEIAEMQSSVTQTVMQHEGVIQMHGFYVDLANKRASFDLIIDFAVPNPDELYCTIVDEVSKLYPDYDFTITLDRDLSD